VRIALRDINKNVEIGESQNRCHNDNIVLILWQDLQDNKCLIKNSKNGSIFFSTQAFRKHNHSLIIRINNLDNCQFSFLIAVPHYDQPLQMFYFWVFSFIKIVLY